VNDIPAQDVFVVFVVFVVLASVLLQLLIGAALDGPAALGVACYVCALRSQQVSWACV